MSIGEVFINFQSALIIPFVTLYHNCFINPRFNKIDERCEKHNEKWGGSVLELKTSVSELKTDVKWIRETLDKQFNGASKRKRNA